MNRNMPPKPEHPRYKGLTDEQALDVIQFVGKYSGTRKLGLAAHRAASPEYSLHPELIPMLTYSEAARGLDQALHEQTVTKQELRQRQDREITYWPIEPTDEQWEAIEGLSDIKPCSIYEAYCDVMDISPAALEEFRDKQRRQIN